MFSVWSCHYRGVGGKDVLVLNCSPWSHLFLRLADLLAFTQ